MVADIMKSEKKKVAIISIANRIPNCIDSIGDAIGSNSADTYPINRRYPYSQAGEIAREIAIDTMLSISDILLFLWIFFQ